MKRDQKAQVVEQIAAQIREAEAVYAVDYRGLSVTQHERQGGRPVLHDRLQFLRARLLGGA